MSNRHIKQILLPEIGAHGQSVLAESHALVVGCGALGCVVADQLARAGVGRLTLVDSDVVELTNLPRQILFDEKDAEQGVPKAVRAAQKLRAVDPSCHIEEHVTHLVSSNADELARGADIVIDATDNLETRYLLGDISVKTGSPWVYGGVVGTTGSAALFDGSRGPCLRCAFETPPALGDLPTCDVAGILGAAAVVVGGLQAAAALRRLLGDREHAGEMTTIDIWRPQLSRLRIKKNGRCPCCVERRFDFLDKRGTVTSTKMCGRGSVQIAPAAAQQVDFNRIARSLPRDAAPRFNGFTLSFELDGHELIVFEDGRVIVGGTTDPERARRVYARVFGA